MPTKKEKQPLSLTHPELAKEVNGWDPTRVTAGSAKKVSWKCAKGHFWDAKIYSRTGKSPSGCPVCSNMKVLEGYNDLSTTHPMLAKELFELDPTKVHAGISKKVSWRCSEGHVFEASPSNRTRGNTGCPVCSGNQVLTGFNDLATTHPELAKQAEGWDPKLISRGAIAKRNWRCKEGHTWNASPNDRTRKDGGSNCPYCSNQKLLVGYNDLATTNPDLAKQAHNWDPTSVVAGVSKKREWRCELDHVWVATVNSRDRMQLGCPYCSNKIAKPGFNDLASKFPDIAKEADGWDPKLVLWGSGQNKSWICLNGHRWITKVAYRSVRGWGCPYCSNQRLLLGFNDFATTHPLIAAEAVGWDTTAVTAGSMDKRKWRCPLGHEYFSMVRDRAQRDTGCTTCAGKNVLIGFNDLATTHPHLASQTVGWDATEVSAGSNKKLKWKCELGHEWISVVTNRIRENSGCPYCKNKTLLTGFNDLATLRPDLAKEAEGWDPSQVVYGSAKVLLWKCENDHQWKAAVVSRTSEHKTGCPSCAKYGFDPNRDGFLYLLSHQDWEMYQIGITNVPDIRLAIHRRNGWEIVETRGPMDGLLAREWESAILGMLKSKGADLSNSEIAGKFDGYSEAWSKSTFKVKTIKELMRLTEEFEGN